MFNACKDSTEIGLNFICYTTFNICSGPDSKENVCYDGRSVGLLLPVSKRTVPTRYFLRNFIVHFML